MARPVTSNLDFGGVAKCVNLINPTNPQDAATRAWVLANFLDATSMPSGRVLGRAKNAAPDPGPVQELTGNQVGAIATNLLPTNLGNVEMLDTTATTPMASAVPFWLTATKPAGGLGSPQDVQLIASCPYNLMVWNAWVITLQAVGSSSCQLRNAAGGLGSTYSNAISTGAAGYQGTNSTNGPFTINQGAALYARYTNGGVTGYLALLAHRIL